MEKKFTRAMLCEEFKRKCSKCPLHYRNNSTALHCWELTNDNVNSIMKDYPYADVKARMIFNDFETRLTAVEEKVEKKDKPKFTMFEVVDKKLYDKLQAKHEADSRLISEYDIENKKLKEQNTAQNDAVCDLYSKLHTEQKERVRCEAVIVDKKEQIDEWRKSYERLRDMDKKRIFDSKNTENERDHYKGLYSSKCDDYDRLLEKQLKTEKNFTFYRDAYMKCNEANDKILEKQHNLREELIKLTEQNSILTKENKKLTESNDTATKENLEFEGENDALSTRNAFLEDKIEEQKTRIANLESKLRNQRANLASLQEKLKETEEKLNDARVLNKMREDVFEANIKLQKIIEAKDREIGLLRAELDKYTPDDDDEYDID